MPVMVYQVSSNVLFCDGGDALVTLEVTHKTQSECGLVTEVTMFYIFLPRA